MASRELFSLEGIGWQSIKGYLFCKTKGTKNTKIEKNYLKNNEGSWQLAGNKGILVTLKERELSGGGLLLNTTLHNRGSDPLFLDRLCPLKVEEWGSSPHNIVFFRQGWQSQAATGSFGPHNPFLDIRRAAGLDIEGFSCPKSGGYISHMVALFKDWYKGEALLIGALGAQHHFTVIKLQRKSIFKPDQQLLVEFLLDGIEILPGAELELEPLVVLWHKGDNAENHMLKQYAELVGEAGRGRYKHELKKGWYCHFPDRPVEEDIFKSIRFLSQNRREVSLQIILVADYQKAIGDWLKTNERFPGGLARLAEKIYHGGFTPGICFSPFITSKEVHRQGEWLLGDLRGRPHRIPLGSGVSGYALDATHPGFQHYLQQVVATLVQEWGYAYLYLDHLYACALPGRRYLSCTRAEALRQGLATIRRAAGEKTYIMAGNCPLGPAVGLVDSMQSGPEVTSVWETWTSLLKGHRRYLPSTRNAVRNALSLHFLHGYWWRNNIGGLLLGNKGLSREEIRTLATAVALTRSPVFVAGKLEQLTSQDINILRATMAISQDLTVASTEVPDLLVGGDPELFLAVNEREHFLAIFNLQAKRRKRVLDLNRLIDRDAWPLHLVEYWTRQAFPVEEGKIFLDKLPPHGVRLFRISRPTV